MEIEELWLGTDLFQDPSTCKLERVEEGGKAYFRIVVDDVPFSGPPTVNLDRKHLKDLHSAIEQELYPERYLPKNPGPTNLLWEEKPTNCPVCKGVLKPSTYREDAYFCDQLHGKAYPLEVDGKTVYRWFSLVGEL